MANQYELTPMQGIEISNDLTRRNLAYGALGGYIFLLAIIVLIGWMGLQRTLEDVLKIVTTLSAVLSGIVGAIIGFYFKEKD